MGDEIAFAAGAARHAGEERGGRRGCRRMLLLVGRLGGGVGEIGGVRVVGWREGGGGDCLTWLVWGMGGGWRVERRVGRRVGRRGRGEGRKGAVVAEPAAPLPAARPPLLPGSSVDRVRVG